MSIVPIYVGLDYHQDSVQVCVLNKQGERLANRAVENDAAAIHAAMSRHGEPRRIAIEACCGAADLRRGAGDRPRTARAARPPRLRQPHETVAR